jgi:hypothetical protein
LFTVDFLWVACLRCVNRLLASMHVGSHLVRRLELLRLRHWSSLRSDRDTRVVTQCWDHLVQRVRMERLDFVFPALVWILVSWGRHREFIFVRWQTWVLPPIRTWILLLVSCLTVWFHKFLFR